MNPDERFQKRRKERGIQEECCRIEREGEKSHE